MSWLAGYLAVINFVTWVAYGLDKGRAKKGKWRISERNLSGCRCCLWCTVCSLQWLPRGS